MHFSRKTLLSIICAIVVLIGGYYFFFSASSSSTTVISAAAPASEAEVSFINLVGQLGSVEFDTRIFDNPRFNALVDLRTPIVAETQGRKDPFGPFGR